LLPNAIFGLNEIEIDLGKFAHSWFSPKQATEAILLATISLLNQLEISLMTKFTLRHTGGWKRRAGAYLR
jgi:hypothetical protein